MFRILLTAVSKLVDGRRPIGRRPSTLLPTAVGNKENITIITIEPTNMLKNSYIVDKHGILNERAVIMGWF